MKVLIPFRFGMLPSPRCIKSLLSQSMSIDEPIMLSYGNQRDTMIALYEIFIRLCPNEDLVFFSCDDYVVLKTDTFERMLYEMKINTNLGILCLQKNPTQHRNVNHIDIGVHCIRRQAIPTLRHPKLSYFPGCICPPMIQEIKEKGWDARYFEPGTQHIERAQPMKSAYQQ